MKQRNLSLRSREKELSTKMENEYANSAFAFRSLIPSRHVDLHLHRARSSLCKNPCSLGRGIPAPGAAVLHFPRRNLLVRPLCNRLLSSDANDTLAQLCHYPRVKGSLLLASLQFTLPFPC